MIKKICFQIIFLSFLIFKGVFAAESGGMPQLNPEFWISQIFWLTLTFGIMYIVLSKFILPKISNNLESRKSQILDNIEAAEKQRKDSETKLKEYDEIISKCKLEARAIINQTSEKALKDINSKKEMLDQQINNEINKAEKEIEVLRVSAPDKINKIAIDMSTELLQKLIGAEVNNSSVSAIVHDLSRKNGDKYYDN